MHSDQSSRWLVRGFYLEDWPEEGDESEGKTFLVVADTATAARATYEERHSNCSSVLVSSEAEWSADPYLARLAATAEHFGDVLGNA